MKCRALIGSRQRHTFTQPNHTDIKGIAMVQSILFFIICSLGYGYFTVGNFNFTSLQSLSINFGVGLGAFIVLGVILNALGIPLDWRIFLCLALILPIIRRFLMKQKLISIQKTGGDTPFLLAHYKSVLLLLIVFSQFAIYCYGAFQYPFLEDDDSWAHAAGIKYIAIEKNLNVAPGNFQYLNPYPPGYDLLFGILHQTSPSLYWTLKFFNALIISLSFLFFYYFVKVFSRDDLRALTTTFFLATIPCYLSHFIWAPALAMTLFFPAFYFLRKVPQDRNYIFPGAVVIAAIFLTQPTHSIKFVILTIIWGVLVLGFHKRLSRNLVLTAILATFLASIWWLPVIHNLWKENSCILLKAGSQREQRIYQTADIIPKMFNASSGTATHPYRWKDFLFPLRPNYINNPIGIGPALLFLAALGIYYVFVHWKRRDKDGHIYSLTALGWLVFTFLGVNSMTFHLPVGLFAFRFWMLLAIPIALFAAEGFLESLSRIKNERFHLMATAAFLFGVLFWSAYPKYFVNTTFWDWGSYWTSTVELKGYVLLREKLTPNTKVFSFSSNHLVIGHDMRADYWTKTYQDSFAKAFELNAAELHQRLKNLGFEYIIVGARERETYGSEVLDNKIQSLSQSSLFQAKFHVKDGAIIFKVM
jgi:hypothetical protein